MIFFISCDEIIKFKSTNHDTLCHEGQSQNLFPPKRVDVSFEELTVYVATTVFSLVLSDTFSASCGWMKLGALSFMSSMLMVSVAVLDRFSKVSISLAITCGSGQGYQNIGLDVHSLRNRSFQGALAIHFKSMHHWPFSMPTPPLLSFVSRDRARTNKTIIN